MDGILTAADWSVLETAFDAAIEMPPTERSAYLDEICRNQADLRARIESLLKSVDSCTIISPAVGKAALDFENSSFPAEGDFIGPYRILKLLGRGGMGVVFQAVRSDDVYQKTVAVKVSAFTLPTPELARQFQRERQILASLDHPHIAMLLDGGTTATGAPYFVMEFVDGQPIDAYCKEHKLDVRGRLELFMQVADAVQYAHRNLVVHRDLKPGNILITSSGASKLLDFGIAKLLAPDADSSSADKTRQTLKIMTPEYAAPEQIRGERTGTSTDIYQLGVILYELLAGTRPFQRDTKFPGKLEQDICDRLPTRPKINADIDRVILKALDKKQAERYLSAADFAADIDRYLAGFPVLARSPSWTDGTWKFLRRNRWGVSIAAVFVLLIIGFGVTMALLAKRARDEANTASQVTEFLTKLFESNDPRQSQGDTLTARQLLDRGAARIEHSLKNDPLVQARLFDTIGALYDTLGARPQAQALLKKSLALRQYRLPNDNIVLANTLHELGSVDAELGQMDQASKCFEEALRLYRFSAAKNSSHVGASLDDLGVVTWQRGETQKAEQMMRQSLEIDVKAGGKKSREALRAMNNLAFMLRSRGDFANAEPLAREILQASIETQGPYSEGAGSAWLNLGVALNSLGKYGEAESTLRNAVSVRTKALGKDHPLTTSTIVALAFLLPRTGKFDEAESLSREALAQAQRASGDKDGSTDYAREALAFARLAQGNGLEARSLLQTVFQDSAKTLPSSSPDMATSWNDLGVVDQALASLPSAAAEFGHALEIRRKALGTDSAFTADSERRLAQVLSEMGNYGGAKPLAEHALRIDRAALPKGHPTTGAAEMTLGWIDFKTKKTDEARPLLEDSYTLLRNAYPPFHPDVARAAICLAAVLEEIGLNEQAKALILEQGPALDRSRDPSYHLETDLLQKLRESTLPKKLAGISAGKQHVQ